MLAGRARESQNNVSGLLSGFNKGIMGGGSTNCDSVCGKQRTQGGGNDGRNGQ